MSNTSRYFYQFSALHALLIGLMPFFIPVLLWQHGVSLAELSLVIAATGAGFVLGLMGWEWLRSHRYVSAMTVFSLVAECFLVGFLVFLPQPLEIHTLLLLGLLNGLYNCFYWTTQRFFFAALTAPDPAGQAQAVTGATFGNFQIVVTVALKAGILIGSALLASETLFILLGFSICVSVLGLISMLRIPQNGLGEVFECPVETGYRDIYRFRDACRSRQMFWFDGVFLYLESYFWILSLYGLTQENVMTLGILVVALALILAVVFYVIKNQIDRMNQRAVYVGAVAVYALSWWLRGVLDTSGNTTHLYALVVLIAFLTSFFRLAFNKRFYDIAAQQNTQLFLLAKSYYSQLGILVFFSAAYVIFLQQGRQTADFSWLYFGAALAAVGYLCFRQPAFHINRQVPLTVSPSQLKRDEYLTEGDRCEQ